MAITYEPIATNTLSTATASITFSSIPATYTDLRVVLVCTTTPSVADTYFRFNGDTANNYSVTFLTGQGTVAGGSRSNNISGLDPNNTVGNTSVTVPSLLTWDVFSYAGSTNKTTLLTASEDFNGSGTVVRGAGLWRNTAAITSITIAPSSSFNTGTIATLYGILKA